MMIFSKTERTALVLAAALGLFLVLPNSARAESVITWNAPQQISGDSDVSTAGKYASGYVFSYFGSANYQSLTTVNGSNFTNSPNGSQVYYQFPGGGGSNLFGSSSGAFSNLSTAYKNLLINGFYTTGTSTISFLSNTMTKGDEYEVELWVNDSRAGGTETRSETFEDGTVGATASQTVNFNYNQSTTVGSLGSYITGTFIYDGNGGEEVFMNPVVGGVSQLNGSLLRDLGPLSSVPEPSSIAMVGIAGVAGLIAVARRKFPKSAVTN